MMAIDYIKTVPSGRTNDGIVVFGLIFLYDYVLCSPFIKLINLYYGLICFRFKAVLTLQEVELLKNV